MNTSQKINLGTRIHCILYGGKNGTITNVYLEGQPDNIIALPGFGLITGGNAEYDVIWDNLSRSQRVPECILRSVQWRFLDEPPVNERELPRLIQQAEDKAEQARLAAHQKKTSMAARRDQLILDHPELEIGDRAKVAAKNIRTQIKQAFKGVKFSVCSDHNSVRISWTDGPTTEQVEEITRHYSLGHFDGNDDSYRYDDDRVWPFGGASYLFTNRSWSDQTHKDAIRIIAERYSADTDQERLCYSYYRKTAIPAGHCLTGIHDNAFTTNPSAHASHASHASQEES